MAAPTGTHFGAGSGKVALDNMKCVGSESHLGAVRARGQGRGHWEDASVICIGEQLASPRTSLLLCPFGHLSPYSHLLFIISCS